MTGKSSLPKNEFKTQEVPYGEYEDQKRSFKQYEPAQLSQTEDDRHFMEKMK